MINFFIFMLYFYWYLKIIVIQCYWWIIDLQPKEKHRCGLSVLLTFLKTWIIDLQKNYYYLLSRSIISIILQITHFYLKIKNPFIVTTFYMIIDTTKKLSSCKLNFYNFLFDNVSNTTSNNNYYYVYYNVFIFIQKCFL